MIRRARMAALVFAPLAALAAVSVAGAEVNSAQSVVVSATPQSKTPNILDGIVNGVATVGNEVVVGGTFTQVKSSDGTTLNRSELLAFNPTTGVVDTNFAPTIAGGEVTAVAAAPGGTAVFVAGKFQTVNGTTQKRLVKINLSDGSVNTTFKPAVSGSWVEDIQTLGNDLYVGGAFTSLGGQPRERFGAVDVNTGLADPNVNIPFSTKRDGTLRVAHFDISPDGTKLVATGTFLTANGQDRAQIAMLDLTTKPVSVSSWETDSFKPACNPKFDTYIRDVEFSPDGNYFVIGDTGAYTGGPAAGVLCDSVTKWDANATGPGQKPLWADYTGGDSITQVAVTGTAIYAGGHQRWMNNPNASDALGAGGVGRMGIAALDPVNGMPFSWNPGRNPRGTGVWALLATPAGLWVGSDTGYIDGLYRNRIALMPVTGGETIPTWNVGALPGSLDSLGTSGLVSRSFDGSTVGAASSSTAVDWSHVRGAFMINGTLYNGQDDGHLYARSFDGTTFGAATSVNLNGLTASNFPIASLTGMAYVPSTGRLYYTVSGSTTLYYRYFEPEDNVVGGQTFTAGTLPAAVTSMTIVGGNIYYTTAAGLSSVAFVNGQASGSASLIASTGDWSGRGLFVATS